MRVPKPQVRIPRTQDVRKQIKRSIRAMQKRLKILDKIERLNRQLKKLT